MGHIRLNCINFLCVEALVFFLLRTRLVDRLENGVPHEMPPAAASVM